MTTPSTNKPPEGRETRAIETALELRAATEGETGHTASGYAALFGVRTNVGGYFTEEIVAGAFTKTLAEDDILAVHSHRSDRVVGRKGAGTLVLREDSKGLSFENPLPDTTDGRDLVVQIRRKDIPGMSFGFRAVRQEWDDTVDPPHRRVIEARLYEITYSASPQYGETEVALRSLEHAREERREHDKRGGSLRHAARRARQAQIERGIH